MSKPKLERPPLKITIQGDEEELTIHMSYGLWSDLQRVMPDAGQVMEGGLNDPWLRDYVIRRCLTPTKKIITDEKDLTQAEDMAVSDPDQFEKILNWVTGHLLYFFGTSATGMKTLGEKFQNQLGAVPSAPSKSGSEASA